MQPPDHDTTSPPARSWNYRAIHFEHGEDSHVAIHEVHYEEGRPISYSETPAPVLWFEAEGPGTGLAILERMREALEKPIMTVEDFSQASRRRLGFLPNLEVSPDFDEPLPSEVLAAFEGEASADFGEELLSRDYKVTVRERLARDPEFSEALDHELADWDSMPSVGRERFWLPAANRYPFKTLIELKRLKLGDARLAKGSKEAMRARIKRYIQRHAP